MIKKIEKEQDCRQKNGNTWRTAQKIKYEKNKTT
jgi:hypothetical protein